MPAQKELKRDLYKCSILGDTAHIEMLYEVRTSPDRDELVLFGCDECTRCGVGTQVSLGD